MFEWSWFVIVFLGISDRSKRKRGSKSASPVDASGSRLKTVRFNTVGHVDIITADKRADPIRFDVRSGVCSERFLFRRKQPIPNGAAAWVKSNVWADSAFATNNKPFKHARVGLRHWTPPMRGARGPESKRVKHGKSVINKQNVWVNAERSRSDDYIITSYRSDV